MQRPLVYLNHRINSAEIQRLHPGAVQHRLSHPEQSSIDRGSVAQSLTACTQLSGFVCSFSPQQTLGLFTAEQDGQIAGLKCVTET